MRKFQKFLLIASLLSAGCDPQKETPKTAPVPVASQVQEMSEDPSPDDDSYMGPLEDGLVSKYLTIASGGGMPARKYTMTYQVDGTEEIKGKTYFKILADTGGFPMKDNYVEYERKADDGHYMISDEDETQTEYRTFPLPLPIEIGSNWEVAVPGKEVMTASVVGFETLTLLGVTYEDCLKIKRENKECTITLWLARGKGGVKCVYDYGNGVLIFILKPDEAAQEKTAAETNSTAVDEQ